MAGRRANQPPPGRDSQRAGWWSRARSRPDRTASRSPGDVHLESAAAAEQERLITEALANLRDVDVREVMTPSVDVVALTIPVNAEDVVQAVRESGHSCFPVVSGGLDDVVGILYVNDLFRSRRFGRAGLLQAGPPAVGDARDEAAERERPLGLTPLDISRRIRHAYVIPESRRILDALVEMRHQRRGFAVVVDEYGGVAGVLTVKDLLEPIVGDLHDEFDRGEQEPSIVRVDGSRWLVDGRTSVDDVRDRLGIDVPEGDYVTLGGYLFDGFGHIPTEGESLTVDGWELAVQEMDKRRVAKVVARRLSPDQPVADDVPVERGGAVHAAGPSRGGTESFEEGDAPGEGSVEDGGTSGPAKGQPGTVADGTCEGDQPLPSDGGLVGREALGTFRNRD